MMGKTRVVVSKIGLDGHDVGAKMVSAMLRDAGMEVIYLGKFQRPEMIVKAAFEENADVIGLSCLSPNHVRLIPKMMDMLKDRGMKDIVVVVGGIVPDPYPEELKSVGVAAIFGPGTMTAEIVSSLKSLLAQKSAQMVAA